MIDVSLYGCRADWSCSTNPKQVIGGLRVNTCMVHRKVDLPGKQKATLETRFELFQKVGAGEVSRGEKMALRGIDPESNITEHT